MLLEVAPRGKLLRAVITLKWFLASMDTLMSNEVGNLTKSLFTTWVVASVRLLLIVDSRMLLKR